MVSEDGHTEAMKQLCSCALLLFELTAVASGAPSAPSLRLTDRTPVTVRGTGFAAGERVSVVLSSMTRTTRVAHAGLGGRFVVRFARSFGRCSRYTLQAYGATGTRARLVSPIVVDCMQGT